MQAEHQLNQPECGFLITDPEDPKDDLFYKIVSDIGVKQVPDYQFYSIPPKIPHGSPTSGPRIFMRMSGE